MKIVHMSFGLANGGKENMLADIANHQQQAGNEVAIVIINKGIEESIISRISPSIKIYKLSRNPGSKSVNHLLKLILILNIKFRPDVIHCHDSHLGRLLRYICNARRVLTIHGMGIDVNSFDHFDKLFAISSAVKDDVESRGGPHCKIVFNGINNTAIKQKNFNSKQNQELFNIVMVKRLNHTRTGQDLLIKAAGILINQLGMKNIRFYFVGDGISRTNLEKMIDQTNLNNFVFLLGNKTREWVYENLCCYDLVVLPSRFEGFGLTIIEAMAAKVPVIASKIDGPIEILENEKFGFLFENNNYDELAKKILEVLELYNTGQIINKVNLAYDNCLLKFTIKQTAANYLLEY
ncbi:MAG: glycosyltransferase [Bacteroidetes bacterium]|nr:glycosyltransferase [Bacteroidota bacterium]